MAGLKIAAQLYTVRDALDKDFAGTLKRVRDLGYTNVELAGCGAHSPADVRTMCRDAGLDIAACHFPIELLEGDINRVIEECQALEIEYPVCPYLPDERRVDESAWKACAETLNKAGQTCRGKGLQLCYHNHSFEFVKFGDRYALDLLFDETDPANLQSELDTYWVRHGGEDPVAYINKLAGRCPILHLKDMHDDADRSFAEVGEGILDFEGIFAAADRAGCVWGIVEQDVCPGDPVDSLGTSLANLRKLGRA